MIDSLDVLWLVERLEAEFGIRIRDEDVVPANFGSIAKIAAFITKARDGD